MACMIRKRSRGNVLLKTGYSVFDNVFPSAKNMEWHFSLIKLHEVVQENIRKGCVMTFTNFGACELFWGFGYERGEGEGTITCWGKKSGGKLKDFEGNVSSHCQQQ